MTKPSTSATRKPRAEAQPYKEGSGYSIRCAYKGNGIYISGQKTVAAARKAANKRRLAIDAHGAPKGMGPDRTMAAQALQDYAVSRLPFKKGAVQEAVRMNVYLRAAHLDTLVVKAIKIVAPEPVTTKVKKTRAGKAGAKPEKRKTVFFKVTLEPYADARAIPNGLHAHRKAQLTKTAGAAQHRAALATKALGEITRGDMQAYIDAMRTEGAEPATIALERSIWRVLFNYAFSKWGWATLSDNAATMLVMPEVDNERKRVMSLPEQELMDASLALCRNDLVAPTLTLLRETAMRSSEPLQRATWGDVDWERNILNLRDSKAGQGEVALSPLALKALRELGPGEPNEPIVGISYESLKAAWQRACERAGIENLHIHDLRRTAATRLALKTGNTFLVQALTRHKTLAMMERYVNVTKDDLVKVLHAPEEPAPAAAAPSPAPTQESVAVTAMPAPAFYTMEQMQALAQLAATAALAGFKDANPVREPVASGSLLTLVTPTQADHYEEDITRYREAA